jgi:branched-chain amino acid transport system substrate-binding protein
VGGLAVRKATASLRGSAPLAIQIRAVKLTRIANEGTNLMKAKSIGAALIFAASCGLVWAQSEPVVIGVLNDMSSTFADQSGPGSVVAARMAIEEVGGTVLGRPIKLLSGDHQNKPDIAATLARRWYDTEGVQLVVDTPNSGTALAVQEVAKQAGRINIVTTAGSVALTNKSCSPTGFHWMWDTYSNSYGLVKALAKNSANTWYFITADYAFGHALEADFRKAVEQTGGKVIGASKHPVGMQDFSALVLAAQASGAKTVVVANGGNDIVNTLKAASEFGLQKSGISFVAPATFLTDVKSMGLNVAQGLTYITGFTWSLDDRSRAFADKFFERHKAMPTMGQAGVYSAVRHYLRAVEAAKSLDAAAVAAKMREMPVEDAVIRHGTIAKNGRLVHDMYLVEVPSAATSTGPWDLEHVRGTFPGAEMFQPIAESECSLAKG